VATSDVAAVIRLGRTAPALFRRGRPGTQGLFGLGVGVEVGHRAGPRWFIRRCSRLVLSTFRQTIARLGQLLSDQELDH
jgi:hypothetical protein